MSYEIRSKNDLTGVVLSVIFPENTLDRKALYTIQADQPPFLVPFNYRSVDGMAECIYHLDTRTKLQYSFGSRTPAEYIHFWENILQPLLDCDDWFLNPLCFVLDTQYLFADKEGEIDFLYIPSVNPCSSYDILRVMAAELSKQNTVTDPALENKVLRFIMQDFQPQAFLQMLHKTVPDVPIIHSQHVGNEKQQRSYGTGNRSDGLVTPDKPEAKAPPVAASDPLRTPAFSLPDVSDFTPKLDRGQSGEKKERKSIFPWKRKKTIEGEKTSEGSEKRSSRLGSFREKKDEKDGLMLGAAAVSTDAQYPSISRPKAPPKPAPLYVNVEEDEHTQVDEVAHFRLVGAPGLPPEIMVDIQPGQTFTIGRFDVSVGRQQSSFEFDKGTKAVSRRHAAIQRLSDGSYVIDDRASAAGTFVDGLRVTTNAPVTLCKGSRVAFGTGGAEYIWEE